MKKIIHILATTIFLIATFIPFYSHMKGMPLPSFEGELKDKIPEEVVGWYVEDLPLGETESYVSKATAMLNFDDALTRSYQRDNIHLNVYVAYWKPGKMPARLVQVHTPDNCWVQAGWQVKAYQKEIQVGIKDLGLLPAEGRIYEKEGNEEYVYFWHIVENQVYTHRAFGKHTKLGAVHSLVKFGVYQKREQFFVRVSSNIPIESVWNRPELLSIQEALCALCLG